MVKNLSAMWEAGFDSCREDPLEKRMATHSSVLAWSIPWTVEPAGLQSMGRKESDMTEGLTLTHITVFAICYHSGKKVGQCVILPTLQVRCKTPRG